jgi:DNA-binding MarR family transcriptional regulator
MLFTPKWEVHVSQLASEFRAPNNERTAQARDVRDKLHQLLRNLDEIIEPVAVPQRATAEAPTAARIRKMLKARRLRERFFEFGLFADPAWDILLQLFEAKLGQFRVSVGALSIGTGVPSSTALRWIRALEQKGLIRRRPDPFDARRIYVELSEEGSETMMELFLRLPPHEDVI